MYVRPKPNESEEDLLQQQEEFYKLTAAKKITPAASIANAKPGSLAVLEFCFSL